MKASRPSLRKATFVAALVIGVGMAAAAEACDAPAEALTWQGSVARTTAKLRAGTPVVIVALGGEFTSGRYPEALKTELVRRFPRQAIELRPRGFPEDRPADMLMRLERDVMAFRPDLVIWEPGAYNVSGAGSVGALRTLVRDGIMRLRYAGIETILLEPGHSGAFVAESGHAAYLETLRDLALERGVPIYRRFETTRHWSGRSIDEADCVARHVAAMIAGATR